MDADWYECENTDGSQGWVYSGETPDSYCSKQCCDCLNRGYSSHSWKYTGAYDTDVSLYPKSKFYIG